MDNEMDLIMGIGTEHSFSPEIKKKLRVGTIKELKEVNGLYAQLKRAKYVASLESSDPKTHEEELNKWIEVLNMITVEGFTKEEFEDSYPEQLGTAISRFLYE